MGLKGQPLGVELDGSPAGWLRESHRLLLSTVLSLSAMCGAASLLVGRFQRRKTPATPANELPESLQLRPPSYITEPNLKPEVWQGLERRLGVDVRLIHHGMLLIFEAILAVFALNSATRLHEASQLHRAAGPPAIPAACQLLSHCQ
jgi:hypothetical protein